jgi:hypothetical protein
MSVKKNEVDDALPTLIILKVDYDSKLIMPVEDALEFVRIWSMATELKEPYQKPKTFKKPDKEFNLKFISKKDLNEMKVAAMLETPKEDNE